MQGQSGDILVLFDEMEGDDLDFGEDEDVGLGCWRSEGSPAAGLLEEGGMLAEGCSLQGGDRGALL